MRQEVRRSLAPKLAIALILPAALALVLDSALLQGQEGETQEKEFEEAMAAQGRPTFRVYCASCHGTEARGDGTLAAYLTVPPTDLTRLSKNNKGVFPKERVRMMIDGRERVRGHGSPDMPVWGDIFMALEDEDSEQADDVDLKIDHLVYFIKSIQEEPQAE